MKKAIAMILLGVMSLSLLTGCGKKEETSAVSDTAQETSISAPEEVPVSEPEIPAVPEGMARSYLTGEWIDETIANQRPLAVMLGNTKIATPQYGITDADVIYEAAVEGQETRLMAIFQDYANLEKVMSIRSCRHYYVHWALEFDAIYAHYGQAKYAVEILSQDYVNNLSGLDGGVEKVMYKRDSNRKAPHNAYTTGEGIVAGIAYKGYETQHAADYSGHYKFVEDDNQQLFLQAASPAPAWPKRSTVRAAPWPPASALWTSPAAGSIRAPSPAHRTARSPATASSPPRSQVWIIRALQAAPNRSISKRFWKKTFFQRTCARSR